MKTCSTINNYLKVLAIMCNPLILFWHSKTHINTLLFVISPIITTLVVSTHSSTRNTAVFHHIFCESVVIRLVVAPMSCSSCSSYLYVLCDPTILLRRSRSEIASSNSSKHNNESSNPMDLLSSIFVDCWGVIFCTILPRNPIKPNYSRLLFLWAEYADMYSYLL